MVSFYQGPVRTNRPFFIGEHRTLRICIWVALLVSQPILETQAAVAGVGYVDMEIVIKLHYVTTRVLVRYECSFTACGSR